MKPLRILESALYVSNLDQAEQFYSQVIGLSLNSKKTGRHVFFDCGEGLLLLFNASVAMKADGLAPAHGSTGQGHIAFEIAEGDFDYWRDQLKKFKVEIERDVAWPNGGHSVFFRDPSQNSLELTARATWVL